MPVPVNPKIYHILHIDRLPSVVEDGRLWSDAQMNSRDEPGTTIGMGHIKKRRLENRVLSSHPGLIVGHCVPFYFCPRSIMLYILSQGNHVDLSFRGGQEPIIHLEADYHATTQWAQQNQLRWAFTLSNASTSYFEDRCDSSQLDEIDWEAVHATQWQGKQEGKQAEFLVEQQFSWHIVT